jgi:hypothetical protein
LAQLATPRKGWENEILAQYILSKFSFTQNPSTVSDDIGLDFICTLFEPEIINGNEFLFPKNSFAIQIKSSKRNIDITNKIDLLNSIELPYLIGVVDQKELKIIIYSGEFLQLFFSHKGIPKKLKIRLTDRFDEYSIENYFEDQGNGSFVIYFPFLAEISANERISDIQQKVFLIKRACSMIFDNISSKRNHEYIFKIINNNMVQLFMYAGTGSIHSFRENVLNRITEAFYNLNWIFDNNPALINKSEYELYKNIFQQFERLVEYKPLPKFLKDSYKELVTKMESRIVS